MSGLSLDSLQNSLQSNHYELLFKFLVQLSGTSREIVGEKAKFFTEILSRFSGNHPLSTMAVDELLSNANIPENIQSQIFKDSQRVEYLLHTAISMKDYTVLKPLISLYLDQVDVERLLGSTMLCSLISVLLRREDRSSNQELSWANLLYLRVSGYFDANGYNYQILNKDFSKFQNFIQSKSKNDYIYALIVFLYQLSMSFQDLLVIMDQPNLRHKTLSLRPICKQNLCFYFWI